MDYLLHPVIPTKAGIQSLWFPIFMGTASGSPLIKGTTKKSGDDKGRIQTENQLSEQIR